MSAKFTFLAWEVTLGHTEKLFLLQLANNADDDGESWYSVAKMSDRCGISVRHTYRLIKEFEELGILLVKRTSNKVNRYKLLEDKLKKLAFFEPPAPTKAPKKCDDNHSDMVSPASDRVSPDPNNDPNKNKLNSLESFVSKRSRPVVTNSAPIKPMINQPEIKNAFDHFWRGMQLDPMDEMNSFHCFVYEFNSSKFTQPIDFANFLIADTEKRKENEQPGFENMTPRGYLKNKRYNDAYKKNAPLRKGGKEQVDFDKPSDGKVLNKINELKKYFD